MCEPGCALAPALNPSEFSSLTGPMPMRPIPWYGPAQSCFFFGLGSTSNYKLIIRSEFIFWKCLRRHLSTDVASMLIDMLWIRSGCWSSSFVYPGCICLSCAITRYNAFRFCFVSTARSRKESIRHSDWRFVVEGSLSALGKVVRGGIPRGGEEQI